ERVVSDSNQPGRVNLPAPYDRVVELRRHRNLAPDEVLELVRLPAELVSSGEIGRSVEHDPERHASRRGVVDRRLCPDRQRVRPPSPCMARNYDGENQRGADAKELEFSFHWVLL